MTKVVQAHLKWHPHSTETSVVLFTYPSDGSKPVPLISLDVSQISPFIDGINGALTELSDRILKDCKEKSNADGGN